ncbi:MAG: PAS domain-containing protein [Anaerolineae bacterium]|nr:PAS domain-containing protein [Anaerolineae bacterium]
MSAVRRAPARRYLPVWGLFLLGAAILGYAGVSLAAQSRLPSDGMLLTELSPEGVTAVTPLAWDTALLVGDHVLAVDGRTIWELGDQAWAGIASDWQVGQTLIYQVQRGSVILDVPVTLRSFAWNRLPVARLGVYSLVLLGMIVAVSVLTKHPADRTAQLFYCIALCLAVSLLLHFQIMTLVTPWMLITELILKWLSHAMLLSALAHLFLTFPVFKPQFSPMSKYIGWIHVINPVFSLAIGLLSASSPMMRWAIILRVTGWIGLGMISLGLANVLHTYLTVQQPVVQGQIRWIAWGSLVSIGPYLVFTGLPEVMGGRPILTIEVTAFFLALFPVALAIAILRYRLFDVDIVIWNTVAHAVLLLVAIGIYFPFYNFILWGLQNNISGVDAPSMAVFLTMLLVVSVFWLLRPHVLRYADRFLYRARVHPQQLMAQMTEKLSSALHLTSLAELLAEELPSKMGATRGGLMVLSEDEQFLELVGQDEFRLPLNEWFALWRDHDYRPILRSNPPPYLPRAAQDVMDTREVELLLPLLVEKHLVGILSLGRRTGKLSYTTAEIRMLSLFMRQAALAVQNALLVRQMETHQRRLQDEVDQRTQVMVNDRNRLNAILQNMADALLVIDKTGTIRVVNPPLENLVRRSARMLIGHDIKQMIPLPDLLPAIDQALSHPGIIEVLHTTLYDPRLSLLGDGVLEERVLNVSVTALPDRSTIICILRDITREVEMDRMKSEFISTVSHELRTPLTSILGFAKLCRRSLEKSIVPLLPADRVGQQAAHRVMKNLDILVEESERLTALVNDVLDIAALDSGTVEWQEQSCDLALAIQQAVEGVQEVADQKGLNIFTDIEDALPVIRADFRRIHQVLINLLSNAVKFTVQGKITVSARFLAPGRVAHDWKAPAEGGIVISVADTGRGISRKEMRQLFERFIQGGDTLLNKPKGTGLGLAICYEIISHYGGAIWADSEVEIGSTFHFALPVNPITTAEPASEVAAG